jgi:CRISPR-associated protein Cas6
VKAWPEDASTEVVDVVFELDAGTIAVDHADALAGALRRALPWLDDEPRAGVLPLSGLGRGDGRHFVGRRSRLVIRMPFHRSASADSLCGGALDLAGEPLGIGRCSLRPLLPVTEVVYSHCVSFRHRGRNRISRRLPRRTGPPSTGWPTRRGARMPNENRRRRSAWLCADAARAQAS